MCREGLDPFGSWLLEAIGQVDTVSTELISRYAIRVLSDRAGESSAGFDTGFEPCVALNQRLADLLSNLVVGATRDLESDLVRVGRSAFCTCEGRDAEHSVWHCEPSSDDLVQWLDLDDLDHVDLKVATDAKDDALLFPTTPTGVPGTRKALRTPVPVSTALSGVIRKSQTSWGGHPISMED